MKDQRIDDRRRTLLLAATGVVGGVGVIGTAVPFVGSMVPSERAKAAGAPVEVDIAGLEPSHIQITEWRGKPVWIYRRNQPMLELIRADGSVVTDPHSEVPHQPNYARNEFRSRDPLLAVLVGVCTHLGCSPQYKPADDKAEMGAGWNGGFYCPCHGSKFDLAGRVLNGSPAPTNLVVPPYYMAASDKMIVGADAKQT